MGDGRKIMMARGQDLTERSIFLLRNIILRLAHTSIRIILQENNMHAALEVVIMRVDHKDVLYMVKVQVQYIIVLSQDKHRQTAMEIHGHRMLMAAGQI